MNEIIWSENKTSAKGNNYIQAEIKDESGQSYERVAIFSSYSKYAEVRPGAKVEGVIMKKMYNGNVSYSLEDRGGTYSAPRSKKPDFAKAQETKREDIKVAQELKHEAIKMAGAQRDAVLIVTTFYTNTIKDIPGEVIEKGIKDRIEQWYKYFLNLQDQPFI